ncbi:hypothetical protein [Capnocytophaga sp. oral taxon 878]|uniref:hypothetical protein n=1 Tax=Capnocytophaga sp. oral taxon 878 TaxID=1316596 RepID=UPI000D033FA6|nr:hypothetical protein [Capnocytophaga sp. oral taxon 878]AVM50464.1 hypothetical protein C4H12_08200 [Capnocytophaga sp. oral taxon 878]
MSNIKKLIIAASLAVAAIGTYLYACGGDWGWGYYYNSIFAPEVTVNKKPYEPLYMEPDNLFYNGDYITAGTLSFRNDDLADWKKYLAQNLTDEAISYFMYDPNALPDIEKYNSAPDKGKVSLTKPIPQKNSGVVTNFFTVLGFARGNEHITNVTYDPWDYDQSINRERTQNTEIQKAEKLFRNAAASTDPFFANRMWLQVLRLKFYSNNRSSVISFFNETHNSQPKNSIYYRGLHYLAGAYKAQGNYAKANAALATLFNTKYNYKQTATFEYHPLRDYEVNQIASSLPADEQCALWAMQGYYGNEETAMQKILTINPKSPHIDFLLSRYVNIIEAKINEIEIEDLESYHQQRRKIITTNFNTDWVIQTANKANVSNPYIWNAAAGYLEVFKNNYYEAKDFLQKAEAQAKDPLQKVQVRLIDIFNEITALNAIDSGDETRLLKRLQWFENSPILKKSENRLRDVFITDFTKAYLSRLYKERGNDLMSEIILPQRHYLTNAQNSIRIEQFLLKPDKTDWEKHWAKQYRFTLGEIYESRALYAFYKGDIDEAIAQMRKTPFEDTRQYDSKAEKWVDIKVKRSEAKLPANPFNGFITDCHDCEHQKGVRNPYSMLSFLEKVKEMQQKLEQGEDVYNNALLLGNAFYNCTYFGNSRFFYSNRVLGESGDLGVEKENEDFLLSMNFAKKYYQIAQQNATNDEQRAKIAYMLAKVERNEFHNQTYFYKGEWYGAGYKEIIFKDWNGFKELRKYPHTKYYKEVLKECGYFKKVANRR